MKKFELDAIYGDGEFEVVARTDSKVVFIRHGTEFLTGEVFLKNGDECTEVYDKIIEADDNAISISAHESDIRDWLQSRRKISGTFSTMEPSRMKMKAT